MLGQSVYLIHDYFVVCFVLFVLFFGFHTLFSIVVQLFLQRFYTALFLLQSLFCFFQLVFKARYLFLAFCFKNVYFLLQRVLQFLQIFDIVNHFLLFLAFAIFCIFTLSQRRSSFHIEVVPRPIERRASLLFLRGRRLSILCEDLPLNAVELIFEEIDLSIKLLNSFFLIA